MGIRIDVFHHLGADPRLDQILEKLTALENHMATQDEAVAKIKADMDAQFSALSTSLDAIASAQANIVADEQNILSQLQTLGELTPANQAILDGIVSDMTTLTGKSQAQATALQAVADSIPDVPQP
jgi:septation ring formation regulator EzrA